MTMKHTSAMEMKIVKEKDSQKLGPPISMPDYTFVWLPDGESRVKTILLGKRGFVQSGVLGEAESERVVHVGYVIIDNQRIVLCKEPQHHKACEIVEKFLLQGTEPIVY